MALQLQGAIIHNGNFSSVARDFIQHQHISVGNGDSALDLTSPRQR